MDIMIQSLTLKWASTCRQPCLFLLEPRCMAVYPFRGTATSVPRLVCVLHSFLRLGLHPIRSKRPGTPHYSSPTCLRLLNLPLARALPHRGEIKQGRSWVTHSLSSLLTPPIITAVKTDSWKLLEVDWWHISKTVTTEFLKPEPQHRETSGNACWTDQAEQVGVWVFRSQWEKWKWPP